MRRFRSPVFHFSIRTHSSMCVTTTQKYVAHGAESVRLVLDKESDTCIDTAWTEVKTVDGITVYRGIVAGSDWNAVKAKGIVGCPARVLAEKLQDLEEMPVFDEMTARARLVDTVDAASKSTIRYVQAKPVFPTSARDFLVITSEKRFEDATIAIASRSITHESTPVDKHFVRAHTHISGYVIRPFGEEQCHVTLIVHMDLGGMLPAIVINLLAVDSPIKLLKRFRHLYGEIMPRRSSSATQPRSTSAPAQLPPRSHSLNLDTRHVSAVPEHVSHGSESVRILLDKASPTCEDTTWTEVKTVDEITVYRGIVAGSDWNAVKAQGRIPCSGDFLADKLQDAAEMTTFDDMTATCKVIQVVDAATKTSIRYVQAKPVFPTSARDFLVVTSEKRLNDGTIAIASRSITHESTPEDKHFVRAHTHVSGYIIRPLGEDECEVTLIVHMDLGGMLPAVVINILAVDSPVKLLKRFRELYNTRKSSRSIRPAVSPSPPSLSPVSRSAGEPSLPFMSGSKEYIQHGAEGVRILLDKASATCTDTTWNEVKSSEGITVYRGVVEGSDWNAVMAKGVINCPAGFLAEILQDIAEMTTFDEMTASCRVVELVDLPTKTSVRYAQAKPVFPTLARDFVVITSEKRLEDGTIAIASRSIEHPTVPEAKGFVRAHTHISGYLVKPLADTQCEVTLIVHMDLGGMLPAVVINILAVDSPLKLLKRFRTLYENRVYKSISSSSSGHDEEEPIDYHAAVKPHQRLGPQVLKDVHVAPKSDYDHKTKDSHCYLCDSVPIFIHRHNCRICGHIVCGNCSTHRIHTNSWKTMRTCDKCVLELQQNENQAKAATSPTSEQKSDITVQAVTKRTPKTQSMLAWGVISSGALLSSAVWTNESIIITLAFFVLLPILIGYFLQWEEVSP
ncbi:hypothetical protein AeRB84_003833 [Aphanomyces euteiches]|nr:hypothetical protein AeRB84_003833 [Aphanomyces euteiches]